MTRRSYEEHQEVWIATARGIEGSYYMNSLRKPKDSLRDALNLPIRTGKRPITIRGPLHVQCSNHGDDRLLRQLVEEVANWPGIEARPFPVGSADLVSFRVGEDLATDDASIFITGREFGRVLFGAPTIYLSLPLSCAHWTIVRGWAEPHFCSSFGLVPPGVMVIYTPRDQQEATVCRSLFRMSYTYALRERIDNVAEIAVTLPEAMRNGMIRKPAALAE